MAEEETKPFQSFREFVNAVAESKHADYLGKPTLEVANEEAFAEMRDYILQRAEGVEVPHSFMDDSGQVFDCMPADKQPSLKDTGRPPAVPPDLPVEQALNKPVAESAVRPQLEASREDRFGNAMQCPPGTIPVRRVTLEELSRFRSLSDFFQKTPVGRGRHPRLGPPELEIAAGVHKYAHAFQVVNNLGGHSFLNIWAPGVGSQVFSLSQHWYAGGTPVQTVECGWQVYPQKYRTSKPVLFIYWTADAYAKTGCYNLECGAFVQTNNQWALGGELNTISTDSGAQYELEMAWHLIGGNWWLYLNGTSSANAIGYYPAALFGSGQLSMCATEVDYGGETVNQTTWPAMGSGAFANTGYQHAAYQRDVFYFDMAGGAQRAALTPSQPSPNCYTIDVRTGPDPWNVHYFFGGPGGNACV